MPLLIYLGPSDRKNKRYKAVFVSPNKTVHFGFKGGSTYIDGESEKTRDNYIKRHDALGMEDWESPLNAGSMSRWILWGQSKDIEKNIKKFNSKFGIEDRRKFKMS